MHNGQNSRGHGETAMHTIRLANIQWWGEWKAPPPPRGGGKTTVEPKPPRKAAYTSKATACGRNTGR